MLLRNNSLWSLEARRLDNHFSSCQVSKQSKVTILGEVWWRNNTAPQSVAWGVDPRWPLPQCRWDSPERGAHTAMTPVTKFIPCSVFSLSEQSSTRVFWWCCLLSICLYGLCFHRLIWAICSCMKEECLFPSSTAIMHCLGNFPICTGHPAISVRMLKWGTLYVVYVFIYTSCVLNLLFVSRIQHVLTLDYKCGIIIGNSVKCWGNKERSPFLGPR